MIGDNVCCVRQVPFIIDLFVIFICPPLSLPPSVYLSLSLSFPPPSTTETLLNSTGTPLRQALFALKRIFKVNLICLHSYVIVYVIMIHSFMSQYLHCMWRKSQVQFTHILLVFYIFFFLLPCSYLV